MLCGWNVYVFIYFKYFLQLILINIHELCAALCRAFVWHVCPPVWRHNSVVVCTTYYVLIDCLYISSIIEHYQFPCKHSYNSTRGYNLYLRIISIDGWVIVFVFSTVNRMRLLIVTVYMYIIVTKELIITHFNLLYHLHSKNPIIMCALRDADHLIFLVGSVQVIKMGFRTSRTTFLVGFGGSTLCSIWSIDLIFRI